MPNETGYLDLYNLFVRDIIGVDYIPIFIFLSFMLIAYLAARFGFPNIITIAMFAIYAIIISAFFTSVLAITLFLVGALFAFALGRLIGNQ